MSWSVFSLGLTVSKVLVKMPTMQVNDISYIDLPVSSSIRLLLTEVFSWSCRSFSWHTVCSWAICSCRVVVCCPNCIDTSVKGQTRLGRSMLLLSSSFFFFFFWGGAGVGLYYIGQLSFCLLVHGPRLAKLHLQTCRPLSRRHRLIFAVLSSADQTP